MKTLILTLVLTFASQVFSQEESVVLQLIKKDMSGNVISKVELFSSNITPNSGSVHDTSHVEVDGKVVKVPENVVFMLLNRMRSHSHVGQSDGIKTIKKDYICYMIQHSTTEYNVRYLTYENDALVNAEMKTVYNNGLDDCTEGTLIRPNSEDALTDIQMNKAVLESIVEYSKTL